jgi:hypothetical protein
MITMIPSPQVYNEKPNSFLFETALIIVFIAIKPETAETAIPIITDVDIASMPSLTSRSVAPRIAGIDIKNTNFTALSRVSPQIRLPKIVVPDLDIPGQIAIP